MENAELIIPRLVSLDEPLGPDKDSVIAALATKIASSGRAEQNGLISDLIARESKSATGMREGIAIPHCRSQVVRVDSLAFARLKEPVDFGAKDGPADLVFMIAAGEGQGRAHLKLLQKLARKLVDKNFLAALRAADSAEKVADIIMEVVAPPAAAAKLAAPRGNLPRARQPHLRIGEHLRQKLLQFPPSKGRKTEVSKVNTW